MNEFKWTLGEPCIRSIKKSVIVPEPEIHSHVPSNKREIVNEKMNERQMISQINQNPFLLRNTYLDDLYVQETFLKPKNSNLEYQDN